MVFIKSEDFPLHAKCLGAKLLGYVLNVDEQEIADIIENGGDLKADQYSVLKSVEELVLQAKKDRLKEPTLSYTEVSSLSHLITYDGSVAFNSLRVQSGGDCSPMTSVDLVKKALSSMCVAYFPLVLLPTVPMDRSVGGRMIRSPRHSGFNFFKSFCDAVMKDEILGRLYEGADGGPAVSKKMYFTNRGGSRADLSALSESLLTSGLTLMHAQGQQTIEDFQKAVWHMLDVLRSAIDKKPINAPAFIVYDIVGVPSGTDIPFSNGRLQAIPPEFVRHFRDDISLPVDNQNQVHGFMVQTEYDYGVQIGPAGDHPEPPNNVVESNLDHVNWNAVSLATSFAIGGDVRHTARLRAHMTICPLQGPNYSWRRATDTGLKKHTATFDEAKKIVKKLNPLLKLNYGKIELSVTRFLSAVNNPDLVDGLIDAAIAFENLTGNRNEIAFSIAVSAANFLFDKQVERRKCFEEVKYAYAARSNFVHGNQKQQEKLDIEKANSCLIRYLNLVLEKICLEEPKLIEMNNSKRSIELATWEHSRADPSPESYVMSE